MERKTFLWAFHSHGATRVESYLRTQVPVRAVLAGKPYVVIEVWTAGDQEHLTGHSLVTHI
ncbi:hypothetical protein [Streptomyces sp. NPDC048272]|uniref:hypothetical protein n=1 Tax=Streptomyces sp. NPDC048272 TaxID=3154616 RepID=UPI003448988F